MSIAKIPVVPITLEHKKPLKDLVDPEYKWKNKTLVQRMQDALHWATENFEICVIRKTGKVGVEEITVKPELADKPPPTMLAITFLRSLASTHPAKFTDTLMRISSNLANAKAKTAATDGRKRENRLERAVEDGIPRARSAEAQARINSLNERIKAAELQRKGGK